MKDKQKKAILNPDKEIKQTKILIEKDKVHEEFVALSTDSLKLIPSNFQHVGARERQEDSFAFSDLSDKKFVDDKGVLAVVADGMGGLARGDIASQVAVSVFIKEHSEKESDEPPDVFLERTLKISNYAVYDLALDKDEDVELGTTLVAVVVTNGKMSWVSAGDSRIYLYREGQIKQLNKEHIYANQLAEDVKNGKISRREAQEHPERGYLTGYLGLPELFEMDCCKEPLCLGPGDAVLLCSDGLTNTLSEDEITEVFSKPGSNTAEKLVNKALAKNNRHQDNVTVMVLLCRAI